MLYGAAFDFLIAFFIATFFEEELGPRLFIALLIVLAAWLFQLAYSILGAIKAAIPFFLYQRKARIAAVADQMVALKMPRPDFYYTDADEYFTDVVKSRTASGEARLMAGSTVGLVEALRMTQRLYLTMTTSMVLEEAIREYGRRVGFEKEADDHDDDDDDTSDLDKAMRRSLEED